MHCVIYVQHSREAGMDAHISKPFDVKTLCICLRRLKDKQKTQKRGHSDSFRNVLFPFLVTAGRRPRADP